MCFHFSKYCIEIIFIRITPFFFSFWYPHGGRHSLHPVPGRALSPHCFHLHLNLEADSGRMVVMLAAEIKRGRAQSVFSVPGTMLGILGTFFGSLPKRKVY